MYMLYCMYYIIKETKHTPLRHARHTSTMPNQALYSLHTSLLSLKETLEP